LELPLSSFEQPAWGRPVPPAWFDVTGIAIGPVAEGGDEDFDLWLDDIELIAAL